MVILELLKADGSIKSAYKEDPAAVSNGGHVNPRGLIID